MWFVGVELVGPEGGIWDLVQYYGDSDSDPLRGSGMNVEKNCILEILKFAKYCTQESLFGPHSVRVPFKTALASAIRPLGARTSDISNP